MSLIKHSKDECVWENLELAGCYFVVWSFRHTTYCISCGELAPRPYTENRLESNKISRFLSILVCFFFFTKMVCKVLKLVEILFNRITKRKKKLCFIFYCQKSYIWNFWLLSLLSLVWSWVLVSSWAWSVSSVSTLSVLLSVTRWSWKLLSRGRARTASLT